MSFIYNKWKDDTKSSSNTGADKTLEPIDIAFKDYEALRTGPNLEKLDQAVANWKLSKGGPHAWIAFHHDAVTWLTVWLKRQREVTGALAFAADQRAWTLEHNCYAYAMKDLHPSRAKGGGHVLIGQMAIMPLRGTTDQNCVFGVIADAIAVGVDVRLLSTGVRPVPNSLSGSAEYLVALLADANGNFHFMRRDEHTQLWSHKNGPHGEVQSSQYDYVTQRQVDLTNAVVEDILVNAKATKELPSIMEFKAYYAVPNKGFKVGYQKSQ